MSRRKDKARRAGGPVRTTRPAARPPTPDVPKRSRSWRPLAFGIGAIAVLAGLVFATFDRSTNAPSGPDGSVSPTVAAIAPVVPIASAPEPAYVGSAACASCHGKETDAWRGSQHELAIQAATDATMLGKFDGARFTSNGVTSTFAKRDGRFVVTTDGKDGKPVDVDVKYTFGLYPLQQYLVEAPGGRMQALGTAWDARPKAQGGQRWFHLYGDRKLAPGHALHWTGIDQNWNYQCADCHSTNLRKNFDDATSRFSTTWTDLSVGCEACHGPGSNHVEWAKAGANASGYGGNRGLVVALNERRGAAWTIDPASGNATRNVARSTSAEIDTCARCHSRRGQFSDAWRPGQPFGDAFRPALLAEGLYHPDGQQRDEVYTWGSFLQSRMHAKGVTCSDCHDPHTQKLRAEGNAVCAQCHAPAAYDATSHTHHASGSAGAQCAACHMPTTTYMTVDPRHDHSFRIPRPDRSVSMGVPNACSACHANKPATWAAQSVAAWFPKRNPGFQTFAEAFDASDRGAPGSRDALARVITDASQSPIARASAIHRLGRSPSPASRPLLLNALGDGDYLVRYAAVNALASADAATRASALPKLLGDPVRLVRMDAARALAGEPESRLSTADRANFDRALEEYVAAQRFNADRPESHASLGELYAVRGRPVEAEASLRKAIEIDPTYVQAALNLADLERALGRDADAELTIRAALVHSPQSAPAHHALGLALIRLKRMPDAMTELAAAARLAPDDARFAFVYAVALHDTGKRADALRVLRAVATRRPYDRDVLLALANYERESGNLPAARDRVRALRELDPSDPNIARLAADLDRAPR